jgi:hypothetical protein
VLIRVNSWFQFLKSLIFDYFCDLQEIEALNFSLNMGHICKPLLLNDLASIGINTFYFYPLNIEHACQSQSEIEKWRLSLEKDAFENHPVTHPDLGCGIADFGLEINHPGLAGQPSFPGRGAFYIFMF